MNGETKKLFKLFRIFLIGILFFFGLMATAAACYLVVSIVALLAG